MSKKLSREESTSPKKIDVDETVSAKDETFEEVLDELRKSFEQSFEPGRGHNNLWADIQAVTAKHLTLYYSNAPDNGLKDVLPNPTDDLKSINRE